MERKGPSTTVRPTTVSHTKGARVLHELARLQSCTDVDLFFSAKPPHVPPQPLLLHSPRLRIQEPNFAVGSDIEGTLRTSADRGSVTARNASGWVPPIPELSTPGLYPPSEPRLRLVYPKVTASHSEPGCSINNNGPITALSLQLRYNPSSQADVLFADRTQAPLPHRLERLHKLPTLNANTPPIVDTSSISPPPSMWGKGRVRGHQQQQKPHHHKQYRHGPFETDEEFYARILRDPIPSRHLPSRATEQSRFTAIRSYEVSRTYEEVTCADPTSVSSSPSSSFPSPSSSGRSARVMRTKTNPNSSGRLRLVNCSNHNPYHKLRSNARHNENNSSSKTMKESSSSLKVSPDEPLELQEIERRGQTMPRLPLPSTTVTTRPASHPNTSSSSSSSSSSFSSSVSSSTTSSSPISTVQCLSSRNVARGPSVRLAHEYHFLESAPIQLVITSHLSQSMQHAAAAAARSRNKQKPTRASAIAPRFVMPSEPWSMFGASVLPSGINNATRGSGGAATDAAAGGEGGGAGGAGSKIGVELDELFCCNLPPELTEEAFTTRKGKGQGSNVTGSGNGHG